MPVPTPQPAAELVTVTLTDGTASGQFHGRLGEQFTALTAGDQRGQFVHHRGRGTTAARRWTTLHPAIATLFQPKPLPHVARDWEFGLFGLSVCLDSDAVTVQPLTDDGVAWLRAHEATWEKRDRLIARFAEFDRDAAETLDCLITELVADAREDGRLDAQQDHS